ncbi:thyroid transcription factor 1-associated protein 26 homolog [Cololabis saira]|uniref:thyroid transcription factor 1-associated protein 26 homolog n=1 Tax=Cololabis saira TaxID=129043 RepID=UPI002AD50CC5|nr:thyroid transcription factor 1-associated protein 26 homolog [Cololabis saira]
MAPTGAKMKTKGFFVKGGASNKVKSQATGVEKKRKWIQDHKVFEGSLNEGQGFAFQRKQKVQHEYNKLLRHEKKKKKPETRVVYKDEYPEHLKHLYLAEAEQLRKDAWTHRVNRSKMRMQKQEKETEEAGTEADEDVPGGSEAPEADPENPEPAAAAERESLPMSNRMRKKLQKKTSYQKTKEDFESMKEKRIKKKEEFLKNKQQRDEAIQKYKQKKMETFQVLSKKTKKGQPNLNLQMDYLLQKIQRADK